MSYCQITSAERYSLALLRRHGLHPAEIARVLGRHRSSISRELRRNASHHDGTYRPPLADWYARGRRSRSRRNTQFTTGDWARVESLVRADWSPEQIAGRLRREGVLRISHETIYRRIWRDKRAGGDLHQHLRGRQKLRRKRYGTYDRRGRLTGKRPITARPIGAERRSRFGHWEGDTMLGAGQAGPCILTLVERKSGYLVIGPLRQRTATFLNRRLCRLLPAQRRPVRTITVDNGTEFHSYAALEQRLPTRFYFATPHHSWERGTNENTNGLIRQYLPKGQSMAHLSQRDCDRLALKLNRRPRKRLGYRTPEECYDG
jgi:transposase, IS30 family